MISKLKFMEIEGSEKASSCQESNPGHL